MNRDLPKRTRIVTVVARIVVCAVLAFSFVVSSLSLAGASASGNAMSCCIGKAAGHCSAGLQAKARPKPEPMCGLKAETAEVIVAEEPVQAANPPASSELITARIVHPCRQDCCATGNALSRKSTRREAATLTLATLLTPVSALLLVESSFSSADAKSVISQSPTRGPPTFS